MGIVARADPVPCVEGGEPLPPERDEAGAPRGRSPTVSREARREPARERGERELRCLGEALHEDRTAGSEGALAAGIPLRDLVVAPSGKEGRAVPDRVCVARDGVGVGEPARFVCEDGNRDPAEGPAQLPAQDVFAEDGRVVDFAIGELVMVERPAGLLGPGGEGDGGEDEHRRAIRAGGGFERRRGAPCLARFGREERGGMLPV